MYTNYFLFYQLVIIVELSRVPSNLEYNFKNYAVHNNYF